MVHQLRYLFWTPTVLLLDPDGKERSRLEEYLPKDEFRAHLEMGLARLALSRKDWTEAERRYDQVAVSILILSTHRKRFTFAE